MRERGGRHSKYPARHVRGAAASIGGARCGLPGGRHLRVQMGGLPRLRGRQGGGGATAAPRWPTGVPWEASSPTRSTPVRAGYGSDYGRRQYCLDGSGGWAWIRGKLQAGVAAAPKSTPSAPIPFLEASVWILRPHLCHERRRKPLFLCLGDDGTLVSCSFLKASAGDCSGWWSCW